MPPIVKDTGQRASTIGKSRRFYQGSASEKQGVGLAIPLKMAVGAKPTAEADQVAYSEAIQQGYRAMPYLRDIQKESEQTYTLPSPVEFGEPRVYAMRPKSKGSGKVLHLRASDDWWRAYKPLFDAYMTRREFHGTVLSDETPFVDTAKMEGMFTELQDAARANADNRGYPFFTLQWDLEGGSREQLYMTSPDSVRVYNKRSLGVLPGMKEMPQRKDLVLYHGGARQYGVVELDHRPTGEGEALEPLPYLRHSPAIWAVPNETDAVNYAGWSRERNPLEQPEEQVYYLDAPGAMVANLETRRLTQRQANALVQHIMESDRWKDARPDILQLERGLGGTEYFIPEGYTPGLVRVTKPGSIVLSADGNLTLPPVGIGATQFSPPSENFCQVMLAEAIQKYQSSGGDTAEVKKAKDELVYWTERCEESKPIGGGVEAADTTIARLEKMLDEGSDKYGHWNPLSKDALSFDELYLTDGYEVYREITKARLAYWKAYRANLEKTKKGYRLKDPAALAKPEIKLLESVYGKAAAAKAVKKASGKPTVAKKAVAVKKASGAPTVASGKAAAAKKAAVAAKSVKPKDATVGAPPPKRRRKPKEPIVAGTLPTVSIAR